MDTCLICGKDYVGQKCNGCSSEELIVKVIKENGKYVSIDNRSGNNWTEEFNTLKEAMDFIN